MNSRERKQGPITECPPHDFQWTTDGAGHFERCMKCSTEKHPGIRVISAGVTIPRDTEAKR